MKTNFSRLSDSARDELARVTATDSNERHHFVLHTEGVGFKRFAAILGLLLIAAMAAAVIAARRDMRYIAFGDPELLMMSVIAALLTAMVVFNRSRLSRLRRSSIRPALVISPLHVVRTQLEHDPLRIEYLQDLQDVALTHHQVNGVHTHTRVKLSFPDGPLEFDVRGETRAQALAKHLAGCLHLVRSGHDPRTAVDTSDWISAAEGQGTATAAPEPSDGLLRGGSVRFAASLLVGALLAHAMWFASRANDDLALWADAYSDDRSYAYERYLRVAPLQRYAAEAETRYDDRSFEDAEASGAATAYRDYLTGFPDGRHVDDAQRGIRELYVQAEHDYLATAETAEPQAAEGMNRLLEHLAEVGSPHVGIVFLPTEGTDADEFQAKIRAATGAIHVHSIAPSFTSEANRMRHVRIAAVMAASFRRVFADDLFALSETDEEEPGPRFLVRVRILPTEDYYTRDSQHQLPLCERELFPDFRIRFDFSLQIPGTEHPPGPDPDHGYLVTTLARPAPNISVSGDGRSAVYDRMVATAFEHFEVNLANAYGLELTMPAEWGTLPGHTRRNVGGRMPGLPVRGQTPHRDLPAPAAGGQPVFPPPETR